jgi:hypothetical protein
MRWFVKLWRLTRYALAGSTADARKPIAPIKEKMAEWRPRLQSGNISSGVELELERSQTYLLKWSADHDTPTVTT